VRSVSCRIEVHQRHADGNCNDLWRRRSNQAASADLSGERRHLTEAVVLVVHRRRGNRQRRRPRSAAPVSVPVGEVIDLTIGVDGAKFDALAKLSSVPPLRFGSDIRSARRAGVKMAIDRERLNRWCRDDRDVGPFAPVDFDLGCGPYPALVAPNPSGLGPAGVDPG
jgi:hypothetical protein